MAELTIEQKAKAYDEAIERAESIYNETAIPSATTKGICTYIFPELKESEDDCIREELMQYLWDLYHKDVCPPKPSIDTCDKWIAWIEKQGEQKPTWIEEDEIALGNALWCCKQAASIVKDENDMGNIRCAETWLKSLKDRVQPQHTWKPSNEQSSIRAIQWNGTNLKEVLDFTGKYYKTDEWP